MKKKRVKRIISTTMPFLLLVTIGNGLAATDTSENGGDKALNTHRLQEVPLDRVMTFNGEVNKEDHRNGEDRKENMIPRIIRIMMELYEKKLSNGCQNHNITYNGKHKSQLKLDNTTETQRNKIIALLPEYTDDIVHWDEIGPQIECILGDETNGIFDDRLMKVSKLFHIDIPLTNLTIDHKDMILRRVHDLKKQGVSLEEIRSEIECLLDEFGVNQYPMQYITCC